MKRIIALLLMLTLLSPICCQAEAQISDYTLDRVVLLSRHSIRSPMSGSGSVLNEITPHEWFAWTSKPSELSLRGAILETMMGQYFRLWLENEGFFPENYQPEDGAVRFYANAKQRTQATARYFSAGLLPVAQVPVEMHAAYDTMDDTFNPVLHFVTDEYTRDAISQIAEAGGADGLKGLHAKERDALSLLIEVTDMEKSDAYMSGKFGDLMSDEMEIVLEAGKEPAMVGALRRGTSVADALILQYYEEPDALKAAFGHALSDEDWRLIHSIADTYSEALFGAPILAVNLANPLLREIRSELTAEGRRFSYLCGHDSNLCSVLASLGVEEYLLPDAVEQRTPVGSKVVFERWLDKDGEAWYRVSLIYQNTRQLRQMEQLTLENPPSVYPLRFKGVNQTDLGMISEADLLKLFDDAIAAYDELTEVYLMDDAA
ncbi:MAG: glucose-1-phosphatase [Clostridia bacterium]|nr:glucose-1-phosphatase [Clostridia bacterium]